MAEHHGMQLDMQESTGVAQELPANEESTEAVLSVHCVSMVVLWGRREDDRYRHVRGYHGLRGFKSINLESLLDGVPKDHGTLVYICPGALAGRNPATQRDIRDASWLWDGTDCYVLTPSNAQAHLSEDVVTHVLISRRGDLPTGFDRFHPSVEFVRPLPAHNGDVFRADGSSEGDGDGGSDDGGDDDGGGGDGGDG
ncbi:hypothetical protein ACIQWN_38120 [Streptomyces vinaceus]|uniref:hypothetical protein n=1 Tax=Streptomyces vinaceus TaxID=1960 RepID=UPI0037F78FE8